MSMTSLIHCRHRANGCERTFKRVQDETRHRVHCRHLQKKWSTLSAYPLRHTANSISFNQKAHYTTSESSASEDDTCHETPATPAAYDATNSPSNTTLQNTTDQHNPVGTVPNQFDEDMNNGHNPDISYISTPPLNDLETPKSVYSTSTRSSSRSNTVTAYTKSYEEETGRKAGSCLQSVDPQLQRRP